MSDNENILLRLTVNIVCSTTQMAFAHLAQKFKWVSYEGSVEHHVSVNCTTYPLGELSVQYWLEAATRASISYHELSNIFTA